MKNNKGMTLVEIIISIALISIVLLFLFMLLVTVNDINTESEVNSNYLINKSLILKNIEDELSNASSITLSTCDVKNDIFNNYGVSPVPYFTYEGESTPQDKLKANKCIKINYNDGSEIAKIGVYYYKNKNSYVISYIHGTVKVTRLLPDFEKYNITRTDLKNDFQIKIADEDGEEDTEITCDSSLSDCTSSSGDVFSTITIPIIGPDEKDYSIIISYYGTISIG